MLTAREEIDQIIIPSRIGIVRHTRCGSIRKLKRQIMNINILQLNRRKSTGVYDDLRKRWEEHNFQIAAIQEPPATPHGRLLTLPDMIADFSVDPKTRPLAGVYAHKTIDAVSIQTSRAWCSAIMFTHSGITSYYL